MSTAQQEYRYFVVGGPVQPDRDCYVEREADELLYTRLSDGEYCHVIAPPDVGKSSLVAHTAEKLRADGVTVAIVDVAQISNRGVEEDVGRWYYSLAYRIARELRIRHDMQRWWQDRAGLTNLQRLREFFVDVVLAETTSPVVVMVDRVEAVLGLEVSRDLFGAIRACFDARATEPEARRLTFAVLGSHVVGHRVPLGQDSPFPISSAIELHDFDVDQLMRLTEGLNVDRDTAREITDRIWYWTAGHPYLSQKIFRAIARRGVGAGAREAVDDIVISLFLAPNSLREEPHLAAVRQVLTANTNTKISRLNLFGKIRKGGEVVVNMGLPLHRELRRTGAVVLDSRGRFAIRNRVYEAVFSTHWVNQSLPFSWRGTAAAVLAGAIIIGLPIWYLEYLPRPYTRTLNAPDTTFEAALDAYKSLNLMPGFGTTADDLFAAFLRRRGHGSEELADVRRYAEHISALSGRSEQGAELLAEFWDRKLANAMQRGQQDHAILYSLRALEQPTPRRRAMLGELIGEDTASLAGTIRPDAALRGVAVDPDAGLVTVLDDAHRVEVWQFGDGGGRRVQSRELVAEEILPLQVRAVYDGDTQGRRLSLDLRIIHPRPADIMVELRAPSGRSARLSLGGRRSRDDRYRFDSASDSSLRPLLAENPNGTWTAYFVDMVQGISGSLAAWSLEIDGQPARPAAGADGEPTVIPEPGVARQTVSVLGPNGRRALTWPADPQVRGDVLVWSIASGEVVARVPRTASFLSARFALENSAVLVTTTRALELWDAESSELTMTVPYEPSLEPVLSASGRYLVVDAALDDAGDNALDVWDLEARKELGRMVTGEVAALTVTDAAGRYLAVSDGNSLVRLWSVASGRLVGEFEHGSAPTGIYFDPGGDWLATQDASHSLRLWELSADGPPALIRSGAGPWAVHFDRGRAVIGSLDRGFEVINLPDGTRLGPVLRHGTPAARGRGAPTPGVARLAAGLAVTADGEEAVKVWRVPVPTPLPEEEILDRPPSASAAAIDSAGRTIAIATTAGDVRILDVGQQLVLAGEGQDDPGFIGHFGAVTSVDFDPDGRTVASGAMDGSLRVWHVDSGAPLAFFATQTDGAIHDLSFGPEADWLVAASRGSVQIVDATTGAAIARQAIQSPRPRLAVSGDGTEILIAGDRGGLTRWDWQSEVLEPALAGNVAVREVVISPTGSLLATASESRRIALWNREFNRLPDSVRLPVAVDHMYFSADGSQLIVQGGLWVFRLQVTQEGLRRQDARLLPEPPAAVRLDATAGDLLLLTGTRGARPELLRLQGSEPAGEAVEEPVTQLRPRLESALQLTLDETGQPRSLQ